MGKIKRRPAPNVLETLFILSLSVTILLLLFWISAQLLGADQFDKLPDWLSALANSIWGALTAGGTSGLLYLWLKQTIKKSPKEPPNYLLWTLATTFSLLIGVFIIIKFTPPPQQAAATNPPRPSQNILTLKFGFNYTGYPHELAVAFVSPLRDPARIVPQPGDELFKLTFHNAKPLGKYLFLLGPTQTEGTFSQNPVTDKIRLCFTRTAIDIPEENTPSVLMQCNRQKMFSLISGEELIKICDEEKQAHAGLDSLFITTAYAAESSPEEGVAPGWTVPSLQTLTAHKRTGFTRFTIKPINVQGVDKADRIIYSIFINSTPIYIDGFEPKYLARKFNPSEQISYQFGLQNLGFSGADNGYEHIEVLMQFLQGEKLIEQIRYPFDYVAIRSFKQRLAVTPSGHEFFWQATYIKAKETDYEVFIASSKNLDSVKQIKQKIDTGKHVYSNNKKVVAVMRPPLGDNPNYGIVLGLLHPTGQIKFTFKKDDALKLRNWARKMNAEDIVFPKDTYLYLIKGSIL